MPLFKPERLAVVSLRASDVPAVVHFYRNVVGLRLMPHHDKHPAFDLGGTYLVIVQGKPTADTLSSSRFPALAFAVEDLDQAIQHLKTHRVDMPWGVEVGVEGRWVLFHDPAGNLIEFVEWAQDE
jgi:catechol-2,3-dioxygenase